jgi:hypothetical protein
MVSPAINKRTVASGSTVNSIYPIARRDTKTPDNVFEELEAIAAKMAPLREAKVELLAPAERAHGIELGPELRAYILAFERYELETSEVTSAELRSPDATVSLRAAAEIEDLSALASLLGLFAGASVIGEQDEVCYLASWSPTASGVSKIYHFHPDDWGLWPTDPSISVRLTRWAEKILEPETIEKYSTLRASQLHETLDPLLDPERIFPRLAWLIHFFVGLGGDFAAELAHAGTIRDYLAEKELISARPNLALYWLWSHHALGNEEELKEVLRLTENMTATLVLESRGLVQALEDGREVSLGMRQGSTWGTLREQVREAGHGELFSARAKKRLEDRDRSAMSTLGEEERAFATLREAATREGRVKEALELYSFFEEGGALKENIIQVRYGLDLDQAIDKFAALIDARFKTPLMLALRRAAKYPDASPHATHGLYISLSKLVKSFEELEQLVEAVGTPQLGPRRWRELCRAYGKFPDERATKKLAAIAEKTLGELESWEPKAPKEAVYALLSRDAPEAEAVVVELLEKASYSGANAAMCLAAVETAERIRSKRAVPGLARAIEKDLGRIDDGGRERVVRALVACAGPEAAPILERAIAARVERWEADADQEASYVFFHKDVAVHLGGWLEAAPDEARAIAKTREVLARFFVELGSGKKARRDLLYAILALFRGIARSGAYGLGDAVAVFTEAAITEDRSALGLGDRVRALAAEIV